MPDDLAVTVRALSLIKNKLRDDESIVWSSAPSELIMFSGLLYKGLMTWAMFTFLIPSYDDRIVAMTIVLVAVLGFFEFRRWKLGKIYVLTNERALIGTFLQSGELKVEEDDLRNLVSSSKSPVMQTVKLQFKSGWKKHTLQFQFVPKEKSPMLILNSVKLENLSPGNLRESE